MWLVAAEVAQPAVLAFENPLRATGIREEPASAHLVSRLDCLPTSNACVVTSLRRLCVLYVRFAQRSQRTRVLSLKTAALHRALHPFTSPGASVRQTTTPPSLRAA